MARTTKKSAVPSKPKQPRSTATKAKTTTDTNAPVPVVGLGASAGGLQAVSAFLDHAPSDSGAAFVLVHHLDPDHESLMADLLDKHTDMPVVLAENKLLIQPDHVYVIPPNSYLEIKDGALEPSEPNSAGTWWR